MKLIVSRVARLFACAALTSIGAVPAMLTAAASAQDLGVKAAPTAKMTVIVGATIHPIDGPAIDNGAIWFDGEAIRGMGTAQAWQDFLAAARFREMPTQIEARGKHVWPGLIGVYTQLGLTEIAAVRQSIDIRETGDITPEVRGCVAVNPDSTLIPVTRTNGVLLAGVFPEGGILPGRPSVIRLDGWTVPEMTVRDACGIIVRWPSVRPISAWWMDRSEDDQLKEIRENLQMIERAFDAAEAYTQARRAEPATPEDLRWEAMSGLFPPEGQKGQTPPPLFIHAGDVDQINSAVAFAAGRGMRCVIIGGRDAASCAELLKRYDVPVIVRGTFVMPKRGDAPYDDGYTLPARLQAAGVRFAIASGESTANERNLPYAAAMAVAHGLSHDQAVQAITRSPAEILGVADRYGSLGEGKSATLILTSGSPLEVTTRVERAFVEGREIDLSNKQTKLAEKYRERYRQTGDLQRGEAPKKE